MINRFSINDKVVLRLLALMTSLPFCMPLAGLSGSIFSEVMAALLATITIAYISTTHHKNWNLNTISAWLLGIALLIGLQNIFLQPIFYSNRVWTITGTTILATYFLAIDNWRISNQIEARIIKTYLCTGILLAGLANSLFSIIQLSISINDNNSLVIFGFLGQRNNFGELLMLSGVSLCWLRAEKAVRIPHFFLCTLLISIALTLSASRTVLIYLIFCAITCAYNLLKTKHIDRSLNPAFWKIVIFFIAMQCASQIATPFAIERIALLNDAPESAKFYGALSGLNRTIESKNSVPLTTRERVPELKKAFIIFAENPILGTGWDSFRKQSTLLQLDEQFIWQTSKGYYTHCHNLIGQIAAETGIFGLITIITIPLLIILSALKKKSSEDSLILQLIGIMLIHSMLEFPLWYFNFLTLFSLLLWSTIPLRAPKAPHIALNTFYRVICLTVALLALTLLYFSFNWYNALMSNGRPSWTHKISNQHVSALLPYRNNPFLDYPIASILISHSNEHVKIPNIRYLIHIFNLYQPSPATLSKEIQYSTEEKNFQKATHLLELAISAYPNFTPEYIELINKLPNPDAEILCQTFINTKNKITSNLKKNNANQETISKTFEEFRSSRPACQSVQNKNNYH